MRLFWAHLVLSLGCVEAVGLRVEPVPTHPDALMTLVIMETGATLPPGAFIADARNAIDLPDFVQTDGEETVTAYALLYPWTLAGLELPEGIRYVGVERVSGADDDTLFPPLAQ